MCKTLHPRPFHSKAGVLPDRNQQIKSRVLLSSRDLRPQDAKHEVSKGFVRHRE